MLLRQFDSVGVFLVVHVGDPCPVKPNANSRATLEHHSLIVGDRQRWSGKTYTPTANPYVQVTTIAYSRVVILVSQSLRFLRKLEWHLPFES
jgi:hypothetical protein